MFKAFRQSAALIHLPNGLVRKPEDGADHRAVYITADARIMTAIKLCVLVMRVRLIQGEAALDVLLRRDEFAEPDQGGPRGVVCLQKQLWARLVVCDLRTAHPTGVWRL